MRGTRLWLLAAAFFVGGVVGRLYIESTGDAANAYHLAVEWQLYCYGIGLAAFFVWLVLQALKGEGVIGLVVWLALLLASGIAILTSIPK